jgi:3-oxoacyl-[acyl-carrier-protein] synthase II
VHWVRAGAAEVPSELVRRSAAEGLAASMARELELGGEAVALATACAAGNYAIGNAFDLIAGGDADVVITGGAEAMARKSYAGFHRLGAIAEFSCQPFDVSRKGMIPAEGAGMLVLESLDHALARGARIHAEILGYGLSCDAKHPTSPDADSIATCIRRAHRNARIAPAQVDYICAHGTGTKVNDVNEAAAIKAVFGNSPPPASSIKSMLGHTMGAASALGVIASVLAICNGYLPPTINCNTPDPECAIDCVPRAFRPATVRIAQNHGFAFGGNNAVVICGAFET